MKKGVLVFWGVIIAVIVLGAGAAIFAKQAPGKYDTLAQCIASQGVKFYGAFWCPHCQATKAQFGNSARLLPYVECSTPDGQGQTQVCKDLKIDSYPTWITKDGKRLNGEHTIKEWADFAGCSLPT
jgi:thiol-disulfide isomerase/thioredoxin